MLFLMRLSLIKYNTRNMIGFRKKITHEKPEERVNSKRSVTNRSGISPLPIFYQQLASRHFYSQTNLLFYRQVSRDNNTSADNKNNNMVIRENLIRKKISNHMLNIHSYNEPNLSSTGDIYKSYWCCFQLPPKY